MKITLKNKIDLTFIAVGITIFVLILNVYSRAEAVKENRMAVYHASTVNALLEKVLSTTIDLETSARGYAITEKPIYLDVFASKKKDVTKWIDSLRAMKSTNNNETLKLDTIEELIFAKITFSDSTILVRKRNGLDSAAKLIEMGQGKQIMDSIKAIVTKYQEQQINLLAGKLKQTEDNISTRNFFFFTFVFLISILIFLAYFFIRKAVKANSIQEEIQKDLIEELSVQNNQLNDFSSIISHNLRAPAANITMLIDTFDEEGGKEEIKTVFDMLRKVSQNLNETLSQLIDIISLKGNHKIVSEKLKFETVLNKTMDNLQGEILQKEATITLNCAEAQEINYPTLYLESIFHNLISNSLKYANPNLKPVITITIHKAHNSIVLSIEDNGLGIDLNKYGSKIFGMNKVFHHHPDAKGVGLFMTKMQVERFGGKISVKSEVNIGTTFTIIFNQ